MPGSSRTIRRKACAPLSDAAEPTAVARRPSRRLARSMAYAAIESSVLSSFAVVRSRVATPRIRWAAKRWWRPAPSGAGLPCSDSVSFPSGWFGAAAPLGSSPSREHPARLRVRVGVATREASRQFASGPQYRSRRLTQAGNDGSCRLPAPEWQQPVRYFCGRMPLNPAFFGPNGWHQRC